MNDRRKKTSLVGGNRWALYAAAGAATALAGENSAEADIHYFLVNTPVDAANGTSTSASFALAGGAALIFSHSRSSSGTYGAAFADIAGGGQIAGFVSGFPYVSNVAVGANIATLPSFLALNARGTMAFGGGFTYSEFLAPGPGYLAFKFDVGAGIQYGWAQVNMEGVPGNSFTVIDYAYADPGQALAVGQIPEPGSLALLALGASGLISWRRKRSAA